MSRKDFLSANRLMLRLYHSLNLQTGIFVLSTCKVRGLIKRKETGVTLDDYGIAGRKQICGAVCWFGYHIQ